MKILPLLWLVTTAYCGALYHDITRFTNSTEPQKITVKVKSTNTSVLMFYSGDVTVDHISDESEEPIICTEEIFVQNLCNDTGTFIIENNENVSIVNTFLEGGGNISLPVEKGGLYHVILFQQGKSVNDYRIVESHSYGFLSLEEHEFLRVLFALLGVWAITLVAFMTAFNWKRADKIGNVYQDFITILVIGIGVLLLKVLHFSSGYWKEEPLWIFHMLCGVSENAYDLSVLLILYKWSCGIFGYDRDTRERLVFHPGFKTCFGIIMTAIVVLTVLKLFRGNPTIGQLTYSTWTTAFVWVLQQITFLIAWFIIYGNSKATEKKLADKEFAKNYGYSRLGFLILPVLIPCGAFLIRVVLGTMEILAKGDVNQISNPNILLLIISNSDEFLMPIMFWVLFFIWKSRKVDGTGFDNEAKHD
jgi:hypothetical protein